MVPAGAPSVPDPLAGLTRAQICASDGLLLIAFPLDDLQARHGGICCGPGGLTGDDAFACEMDWPFNDVPGCEAWDHLRNAIFARYGYPFTTPEYREMFGQQPWYARRDDFSPDWLSATAKANVDALKDRKARRVSCSP